MFDSSFTDLGIPPGYGFRQLLFNPTANVLVVQTTSGPQNWRPERLYFRHVDSAKYMNIGTPDDFISQESPVVSLSEPLLAFSCLRNSLWIDSEGAERHGANWESLKVHDLRANQEVYSLTGEMLRLPAEFEEGWISSILSFEIEPLSLFVAAALANKNRNRISYFVSKLRIQDGTLKLICPLPSIFM